MSCGKEAPPLKPKPVRQGLQLGLRGRDVERGQTYPAPDGSAGYRHLTVDEVNRTFYQSYPLHLVGGRIAVLALLWSKDSEIIANFPDPLDVNETPVRIADLSPRELADMARLEVLALRYHLAEAVFATYWVHAHAGETECPWYELKRFDASRRPDAARRFLTRDSSDDAHSPQRIATTVFGGRSWCDDGIADSYVEPFKPVPGLLDHAARMLVEDYNATYNAYKHSFAAIPLLADDTMLETWVQDGSLKFRGGGPSTVFARATRQSGSGELVVKTESVDFPALLAVCHQLFAVLSNIIVTGAELHGVPLDGERVTISGEWLPPHPVADVLSRRDLRVVDDAEKPGESQ